MQNAAYASEQYVNLTVCDHPVLEDRLNRMRDKDCPVAEFRGLVHQCSLFLAFEATRHLRQRTAMIETPLAEMNAQLLDENHPVVVPILRSGLGMVQAFQEILPESYIGHVGVYRDHDTKEAVEYMVNLPEMNDRMIFLVDPMLATGHSAVYALDVLVREGAIPVDIVLVTIVSAPEGIDLIQKKYTDVRIITATLDSHLDDNAYIVPGLGDAGDRQFGTF